MSLVLNTNIDALIAQNSLTASGNQLTTALQQLSTGLRINTAADDAASYAIAQGIADPDRLGVAGKSYGAMSTDFIIAQTTRFKAAVTGAGAVEHAANWGNDDVTWDDAWYLNGKPWETPQMYAGEAALFRMNRVKTPTHIVQGNSDVRVSYLEGVTLERALQQLGVDHSFLVFPGEGHDLAHNPWHGYIKLRE